jgi:hypothetical protein
MSTQNLIRNSLAVAFVLTLSGAAFARQPPALVNEQAQTAAVLNDCPKSRAGETSGYRGMLARNEAAPRTERVFTASQRTEKMGDHVMLICGATSVHQGSGYRDFPMRTLEEPANPQIASGPALVRRR